MDSVDCVVIGAGAVGLAVTRRLAAAGLRPLLIERHPAVGMETSARNSEVIHAGLYYAPGSLKARLCLRGSELLYAFCTARGVIHRRCGKLVVADAGQEDALLALLKRAHDNGATEVRALDAGAARAMEPELRCTAALHSPATGILDSHAYLLALLGEAEQGGATLATSSAVTGLSLDESGIALWINGAAEPLLRTRRLVNAAGLDAVRLARSIRGFPAARVPQAYFAKGSYFTLEGRAPFSHLVYPLPQSGGLGVHLTLDLAGQARFGPDVEWLEPGQAFDYAVDPARAASFAAAIRRWWPGVEASRLQPGYAGIRPKLHGPGDPAADFRIEGPETHGVAGLVHLFGIESPGLTASLAIAEQVGELLGA